MNNIFQQCLICKIYLFMFLLLCHCGASSSDKQNVKTTTDNEEIGVTTNNELKEDSSETPLVIFTFEEIKSIIDKEQDNDFPYLPSYMKRFHPGHKADFKDMGHWKIEEWDGWDISFLMNYVEDLTEENLMKDGVGFENFKPEQLSKLDEEQLKSIEWEFFSPHQLKDLNFIQLTSVAKELTLEQISSLTEEQVLGSILQPGWEYDQYNTRFTKRPTEGAYPYILMNRIDCEQVPAVKPSIFKKYVQYFKYGTREVECFSKEQMETLTLEETAYLIQFFSHKQLRWLTPAHLKAMEELEEHFVETRDLYDHNLSVYKMLFNNSFTQAVPFDLMKLLPPEYLAEIELWRLGGLDLEKLSYVAKYNETAEGLLFYRAQGRDLFIKNEDSIVAELRNEGFLFALAVEQYESMSEEQVQWIYPYHFSRFSPGRISRIRYFMKYLHPETLQDFNKPQVRDIEPKQFQYVTEDHLRYIRNYPCKYSNWMDENQYLKDCITAEQFNYFPPDLFIEYIDEFPVNYVDSLDLEKAELAYKHLQKLKNYQDSDLLTAVEERRAQLLNP